MSLEIVLVIVVVAGALFYIYNSNKQKEAEQAAEAAAQAEAWKTDYRNPASPTYDPDRVAAEEALTPVEQPNDR